MKSSLILRIARLITPRWSRQLALTIYAKTFPTWLTGRLEPVRRLIVADGRRPLFDAVFEHISSAPIAGDYCEFGVFHGDSFIMAYHDAQARELKDMAFFAFDSFRGLPEDEGEANHLVYKQGDYSASLETFMSNVNRRGVDLSRVRIVEGFYEAELLANASRKFELTQIAVAHIDCDIYSSTEIVLRFIGPLMAPGSVLIFDDWFNFGAADLPGEEYGEQRAFNEWDLRHAFEPYFEVPGVSKAFIRLA